MLPYLIPLFCTKLCVVGLIFFLHSLEPGPANDTCLVGGLSLGECHAQVGCPKYKTWESVTGERLMDLPVLKFSSRQHYILSWFYTERVFWVLNEWDSKINDPYPNNDMILGCRTPDS